MTALEERMRKLQRERERLQREAEKATCAREGCSRPVTVEDRCQDGLYLHRECAAMLSPMR